MRLKINNQIYSGELPMNIMITLIREWPMDDVQWNTFKFKENTKYDANKLKEIILKDKKNHKKSIYIHKQVEPYTLSKIKLEDFINEFKNNMYVSIDY